ncbi:hypothetical protein NY08_1705 [Rhodococcus sp. B7740]|nr:hypothetical protein NY08_1705 [Rhodococcus sp. B7740]
MENALNLPVLPGAVGFGKHMAGNTFAAHLRPHSRSDSLA